jgi:hypothetical protein
VMAWLDTHPPETMGQAIRRGKGVGKDSRPEDPRLSDWVFVPQHFTPQGGSVSTELRNQLAELGLTVTYRGRPRWELNGWPHKWLQVIGPPSRLPQGVRVAVSSLWSTALANAELPDDVIPPPPNPHARSQASGVRQALAANNQARARDLDTATKAKARADRHRSPARRGPIGSRSRSSSARPDRHRSPARRASAAPGQGQRANSRSVTFREPDSPRTGPTNDPGQSSSSSLPAGPAAALIQARGL